jgi:hypothetical protein
MRFSSGAAVINKVKTRASNRENIDSALGAVSVMSREAKFIPTMILQSAARGDVNRKDEREELLA